MPESRSPDSQPGTNRRDFLKTTAAGIIAGTLVTEGCAPATLASGSSGGAAAFRSDWPAEPRPWPGPEYWSNPLQDWRVAGGRMELVNGGAGRNVHLLTRELANRAGRLESAVRVAIPAGGRGTEAGFWVGVQGPLGEYRNNAIHGKGLKAGVSRDGRLFLEGGAPRATSTGSGIVAGEARLRLVAEPSAGGYRLTLSALDAGGRPVAEVTRDGVPAASLVGNLALFADADEQGARGTVHATFADWTVDGDKVDTHEDRAFGPVLFNQYTLSRGVMKMTAQMPPVGAADGQSVRLEVQEAGGGWRTVATERIDPLARTATFRVANWDDTRDTPYRLAHEVRRGGGRMEPFHFTGTVRRDPVDKPALVVAGLSCMVDAGFPNAEVARGVAHHDPDVLAFMGDQLYEASGGFGVLRVADVELASLDYLRKWYLYGWSFFDLMRDRPTICISDDHDVYHGNIWGEGGENAGPTYADHPEGGYFMPARWVNMVQRTQASHLPDPFDPTPVKQGITVYYTDMVYGRVSFALLEDRKWKTGPEGVVPPTGSGRPDHVIDSSFDVRTLDVPGTDLLGERQHRFLDHWAADWRGADLKVAVSQTIFANIPNLHGEEKSVLVADLDTNAWPQTPRNEALRRIRKASAFHLCGDQHLPMLVHYGIDDWEDAAYTFCVPAIATGYPRAFRPELPGGAHRPAGVPTSPEVTGRFLDGLGNRVTIHAVANPVEPARRGVLERLADKASGYGIVRLDRANRKITMECWPMLADPSRGDGGQFPGWPRTIDVADNAGRTAARLPEVEVEGLDDAIVQVVDPSSGEVVQTVRAAGKRAQLTAPRPGEYTVRVGDESGWRTSVERVAARVGETGAIRVTV